MRAAHACRWRIAEPDGRAMLPGVCRICERQRLFTATPPEDVFVIERYFERAIDYRTGVMAARASTIALAEEEGVPSTRG